MRFKLEQYNTERIRSRISFSVTSWYDIYTLPAHERSINSECRRERTEWHRIFTDVIQSQMNDDFTIASSNNAFELNCQGISTYLVLTLRVRVCLFNLRNLMIMQYDERLRPTSNRRHISVENMPLWRNDWWNFRPWGDTTSRSTAWSQVHLARKPTNEWRFTIVSRNLNKVCRKRNGKSQTWKIWLNG